MSDKHRYITILALSGFAYFVSYPEDAEAIIKPIATVMSLTEVISPSFYGVVAVGIIAIAIFKTWGGRVKSAKD